MSDVEDLGAKAARLWLEFMQAQAKAAAAAASRLPEVTRSLAEAGVPLAAEVNRWMEGALAPIQPGHAPPDEAEQAEEEVQPSREPTAIPERQSRPARPLARVNHRRLKAPKSMSRRRSRRA
jgi:hypothetical protein